MADAGEAIAQAPAQAGRSLGHKLGPLPVWAWMVVGVVGAAGVYYVVVTRKGGAAPSFPNMPGFIPGGGGSGGGGSTGGGPDTGAPAGPTTATANQIQAALSAVATSLRLSYGQVKNYWDEYMAGVSPVGNAQASGSFNNVVNAILTQLGASAPQPAASQGPNANPYNNNQSWLNAILGALPAGRIPASVIAEITAVVNGTSNTLSQQAAQALADAEAIVGNAPTALSYTVTTPTTGTSGPSVSLSDVNAWANKYLFGATQNFATWVQDAPSVIANNFNSQELERIYVYFAQQSANGVRYTGNQLPDLINGWLADHTTIPQNRGTVDLPPGYQRTATTGAR